MVFLPKVRALKASRHALCPTSVPVELAALPCSPESSFVLPLCLHPIQLCPIQQKSQLGSLQRADFPFNAPY